MKIKNSKGEVHRSCPYIDDVLASLVKYSEIIDAEDFLIITGKLERVRAINDALRRLDYNFSTVIKRLKTNYPDKAKEIDDTIKLYY